MKKQSALMAVCTVIQVLAAVLFGIFNFCQTQLMNSLEKNSLNRGLFIGTAVFLLMHLLAELLENYARESSFAKISAGIKREAARAFLSQNMQAHAQKSGEQHISFLSNEVSAVLNQYFYLRLYERKQLAVFFVSLCTLFLLSWQCGFAVLLSAVCFGTGLHFAGEKLKEKQQLLQSKKAVLLKLELLSVGQNMMLYILILIVGGILAAKGLLGVGVFVSAAELSVLALNEWSVISRMHARVKGRKVKVSMTAFSK